MRIAIPLAGALLADHFGHCPRFGLFDADPETRRVVASSEIDAPEHQPGLLPSWLKERGVTHVIAGGMGARARTLCEGLGIEVVTGAAGEAAGLVESFLRGELVSTGRTCTHH